MKRVVNGRVCDTSTACVLGDWWNGASGINYFMRTLYRSRSGVYFIHSEGGANTICSVPRGDDGFCPGESIEVLSFEAAKNWAKDHLSEAAYNHAFPELLSEADASVLKVRLSAEAFAKLKRQKDLLSKPMSVILTDLILSADWGDGV